MTTAATENKVEAVRSIPDYAPAPQRTLGWAVIEWIDDHLVDPKKPEEPLKLTREQVRFILRWYEIKEDGRFRYASGALRRMRGTGKSPFAAILSAVELCGPCRFSHFDGRGFPVAVPEESPWIQLAAVSKEQTAAVMDILRVIFTPDALVKYDLAIGREQIIKSGPQPGKLVTISSNPRANRGGRVTFLVADETSEWTKATGGHAMLDRIIGNLGKGGARMLELSNAYVPGEDSVAERTHRNWQKQVESKRKVTIYYDSLEAPADTQLHIDESLRPGLIAAMGDAWWLYDQVDGIMDIIRRPGMAASFSRREWLNQVQAEEDSLINQQVYAGLMKDTPPLELGDEIAIGFDGSLTGDGTAIVAFRISDKTLHVIHYTEPDPLESDWRVDELDIDGRIRSAIERDYKVVAMAADDHPFESWVAAWERDYGHLMKVKASGRGMLIFDNRTEQRKMIFGLEALLTEMNAGRVKVCQSEMMKQHWQNAKFRQSRWGASFGKETPNSKRRIDIMAASLMAYIVGSEYIATRKTPVASRKVRAWGW